MRVVGMYFFNFKPKPNDGKKWRFEKPIRQSDSLRCGFSRVWHAHVLQMALKTITAAYIYI